MRQKKIFIGDSIWRGLFGWVRACCRYFTSTPTKVDVLIVVGNERDSQRSGCIGACCCTQRSGCIGAFRGQLAPSTTMYDALNTFPLTVDRCPEVSGSSPCQGWHAVRAIFIVISEVPEMFSVLIDRRGTSRDRCIRTSVQCVKAVQRT